jgi:hypothetical protein
MRNQAINKPIAISIIISGIIAIGFGVAGKGKY